MINSLKVKFLSLAFLLFGALAITVGDGYIVAPLMVLLLSLFAYFDKEKSRLDRDDWYLVGALVIFSLVGVADTIFHKEPLSNFDLFSRYLIGAWVLYYLLRYELDPKYLIYGYAIGAIIVGVYSLYAYFYLGYYRVHLTKYHSIQFGNISLLMAFFNLAAAIYALQCKKIFFTCFISGCYLLGNMRVNLIWKPRWVACNTHLHACILFLFCRSDW